MRFPVVDRVTLADHGRADRLHEMTLPRARRAEQENVLVSAHEPRRRQLEHQLPVQLPIEPEVEPVERLARVAEPSLLQSSIEQAVLAPHQLVADQHAHRVDRRLPLRLRLQQPELQRVGHPR